MGLKLKMLKGKIIEWVKNNFEEVGKVKAKILDEIQSIDRAEEVGTLSSTDVSKRLFLK